MDSKTWLWRKKSSEKTIVVGDKVNSLLIEDAEEKLVNDNTLELERTVKNLNEKLSSALSDCNAKSDLVTKHEKVAEESLAGWEKAEAESASLKQELDEALRQTVAKEERIAHLDAALKECMQQLRFVREEQEQRIHDVMVKTAKESEKIRMVFEEKLAEANKRLGKLNVENNHLSKALHVKEKLVEELSERNSQAEADFSALLARLDSTEKTNASMKYELCMLEKELEIRNEEKEFNRRTADATQKQHLESVKKIAKLETECQRLRLLVRKRLPGPAALAKMKTEVEMLGREATDTRRKLNSPIRVSMVKDFVQENSSDSPSKSTNYLLERLCAVEEENKTLKETLSKKDNELQSSNMIGARTASNLSQVEAQLAEISKGQKTMELTRHAPLSHESPLASIVENNSNGDTESWAYALISELDHFKSEKPRGPPSSKSFGVSDISLMDDFVEMEKLAIVSVDKSFGSSHVSDESNTPAAHLQNELRLYPSEGTGKELVPVTDTRELQAEDVRKYPGWLQDVLRIVLEQKHATQRKLDEILKDIITALGYMNNLDQCEVFDGKKNSSLSSTPDLPHISGYISWRPPNSSAVADSFDQASGLNISLKEVCTEQFQSTLSKSLRKLIALIEGILNQPSLVDHSSQNSLSRNDGNSFPYDNAATPTGYMVRVFQWKSSELSAVLRKFSHTCDDLLNGKTDLEQFAGELTSAFDWVMNHCFSLQDVSSMRDTVKKHFDWDESQSENELGVGMNSLFSETEKAAASDNQSLRIPSSAASNERNLIIQMEEMQLNLREENRILRDELAEKELEKKDLEGRIQSATEKLEGLTIQLQESKKNISSLQAELETSKKSKGMIEDQIQNYKLLVEDLNTQLSVARVELSEARQKFSSLEAELEDRSSCCQELESTCLELQLQLESLTKKEPSQYDTDREERKLQTDWEITAASEKLAECQETILNLGKQLKALASPRDAALLDKVISVTPATTTATTTATKNKNTNHRSSLLDQMLAEDDAGVDDPKSPMMKEIICTTDTQKPPANPSENLNGAHNPNGSSNSVRRFPGPNETKYKTNTTTEMALAIVPSKKRGSSGGFLRKLLSRRKRGSKMSIPTVM
ncbi:Filament-like plant protein [Macleaya cordata]|uniref:Filament-like plant protein n=1 Tax=Macleaya cordata TaxID=56857 RepID=A0A200QYT6_MACCD|nr:Filament-like plant protein [Macleaya cordata]